MNEEEYIQRLQALWKSGRDKYQSFFTVLGEVRDQIGDKELDRWCYSKLLIGLEVIFKVTRILKEVDEAAARRELAAARVIAKEERRQERIKREQAKFEREQEKIARRKELATRKAEAIDLEKKNAKKEEKQRRRQQRLLNLTDVNLENMIKQYHAAEKLVTSSHEDWIDGSFRKCKILAALRDLIPDNHQFGERLHDHDILLSKNERTAMIGLGRLDDESLRKILSEAETRSFRLIWEDVSKLKAVEG